MDSVDAMDYKDVAYQHNKTRWTRRDGYRLLFFAKVRVAGSNPVVRSKNSVPDKASRSVGRVAVM